MGTLEERGWIGSDDSRPTKYFAKSPSTALETSKQSLETEFSKNQNISEKYRTYDYYKARKSAVYLEPSEVFTAVPELETTPDTDAEKEKLLREKKEDLK